MARANCYKTIDSHECKFNFVHESYDECMKAAKEWIQTTWPNAQILERQSGDITLLEVYVNDVYQDVVLVK